MYSGPGASERQWVSGTRPMRGWDPYSNQYMTWPLEYEEVPRYENAKHVVIKESKSGAVDVIQSISNLIEYGEELGFSDKAYEELFLMFTKAELPEALSGITRFNGHVNRIFSALTDLVHGDFESEKCRISLRSLVRPAYENISVIMNKIKSLYMALYQITHASMTYQMMMVRVEQHCIEAIQTVINPETKEIYLRMAKSKVEGGRLSPSTKLWTSSAQLNREQLLVTGRLQNNYRGIFQF